MTGDNSRETPKGSDEGLERRKAAPAGSDKQELTSKADAGTKEQTEASQILSQAANATTNDSNALKSELPPKTELKGLVAMQGVLDPAGESPIKTGDDMYERMFNSSRETKAETGIGEQFWNELPAEKQVKTIDEKIETKSSKSTDGKIFLQTGITESVYEKPEPSVKELPTKETKIVTQSKEVMPAKEATPVKENAPAKETTIAKETTLDKAIKPANEVINAKEPTITGKVAEVKETTVISDEKNAHVPFNTENKVVLQISATESVYKTPAVVGELPKTKIAKDDHVKPLIVEKPIGKGDVPFPPQISDVKMPVANSGTAIDAGGHTIGHWFDGGKKLVINLTIDATPTKDTPRPKSTTPVTRPSTDLRSDYPSPGVIADAKADTPSKPATPPRTISSIPSAPTNISSTRTFEPPSETQPPPRQTTDVRIADTPVTPIVTDRPVEKPAQSKDVMPDVVAKTPEPNHDVARAVDSITRAVAPVQQHADNNHPLGAALVQKASIVQRDVHDAITGKGAQQDKAIASLDTSVKDYNKLVETNKATAPIADKLKISVADVSVVKSAVEFQCLENAKTTASQFVLSTKIDNLYTMRDLAHANLLKTIDLIEQSKDADTTARLVQTAMILSLATNRDLSSHLYTDISAATLYRAISDSTVAISYVYPPERSPKIDFAPEREALAKAETNEGQSVRLDNPVNPIFAAVTMNAGVNESKQEFAKVVEERAENQRIEKLPDWMKPFGHRVLLSPDTVSSPETSRVIAFVQRTRTHLADDARIVSPTFKPLSTLGNRHTLAGRMPGIPGILGGFDAVSLAQYNHLMQLLHTAEDAQQAILLKRYPYLANDVQKRQSALFVRPDSRVDFGPGYSLSSTSTATASGQQEPPSTGGGQGSQPNQDEEA